MVKILQSEEVLTWIVFSGTLVVSAISLLQQDFAMAAFGAFAASLMVLPAVFRREWSSVAEPEAALLAGLPFLAELLLPFILPRYLSYLAASGIAMIVASELESFTEVKFNHTFAILFVATVTIASSGFWALARYGSDLALGTSLLRGHDGLMWEFVLASASGFAAGGFFDAYFERWKYGH